jgi:hypothetical protein
MLKSKSKDWEIVAYGTKPLDDPIFIFDMFFTFLKSCYKKKRHNQERNKIETPEKIKIFTLWQICYHWGLHRLLEELRSLNNFVAQICSVHLA